MELHELDFEQIGHWPWAIKAVFIGLCCTILFILSYWFLIKPKWDQVIQIRVEQGDLLEVYRSRYADAANLTQYQKQLTEIEQLFGTMLQQLPNSSEVPNLIEDMSKLGTANGLDFELIKPESEREQDFLTIMPIRMIVKGNYHQLAGFIGDISALPRIVAFDDFTIRRQEESDQLQKITPDTKLSMDIMAKTFRYRVEPSAEAKL